MVLVRLFSFFNTIHTYHILFENVKSVIYLPIEIIPVLARYGNVIIFGGAYVRY